MPLSHNSFQHDAASFLQQTCRSLKHRFLTNFTHDITFGKGQITMLVSNVSIFKFYQKNQIPMLCTNDSGRTLDSGIYLNTILENQYKNCSVLMPLLPKIGKKLGQNYGKNSLHLVTKENDCQHLYSLFFDLEKNEFLHWVVNNGNFLKDLISEYNHSAKDIIQAAKSCENRIVLPNSEDTPRKKDLSECLQVFHKDSNIPIHLSKQQSRCLTYLAQGNSTKEIASFLNISPRTVEHYIEIIRNQLNCKTTKQLMAFYGGQLR